MERMDTNALHDRVTQIVHQITSKKYQFSFNFGSIRKDSNQFNSSISKWNKAIIIEAKREEKEMIYNLMGRIFSSKSTIKVLGMNLRLVPMLSKDLPSHTKMKISHLVAKQEQFLSTLLVKPCVFLSEIDYYNTTLETTMRDIIMDLETLHKLDTNDQPMKIFLSVDYSQWHSSYVLTFPSYLEKEADDFIAQLPAYLHYVYGDEILLMLTAEGSVSAQNSKWDPEKLCATSNVDLELDAVTSESLAFGWLPDLQEEMIQFDTSNIELQSNLHRRATDADSISTFQKNSTPIMKKITNLISPNLQTNQHPSITPDKINEREIRESPTQGNMNTSSSTTDALGAPL